MAVSLSAIQENLVVLLIYDDTYCFTIRNLVEIEFWGGPFKLIASRVYEYIDRYKKAPKDHIADLMADKLEDKNREASLFKDIILSIKDQQGQVNAEYVMSQLDNYIRRQAYRTIAIDLAKAL